MTNMTTAIQISSSFLLNAYYINPCKNVASKTQQSDKLLKNIKSVMNCLFLIDLVNHLNENSWETKTMASLWLLFKSVTCAHYHPIVCGKAEDSILYKVQRNTVNMHVETVKNLSEIRLNFSVFRPRTATSALTKLYYFKLQHFGSHCFRKNKQFHRH